MSVARPIRDATLGTLALVGAIWAGSAGFAHVDPALLGYLGATVVAAFAVVHRTSVLWRRPPAAFYARALLATLRRPRALAAAVAGAGRDLGAQRFIARRSHGRWLAHLLLSGGTLASFAITLPLVWGWLRFDAEGRATYRVLFLSLPLARLAARGPVAWLAFHALVLAAIAVVLGAGYFLALRLRSRRQPGTTGAFHMEPLLLLLAVALTGLALPVASHRGSLTAFETAAALHELSVVALLVALPTTKLAHLLVRPLHLGAQLVRAAGAGAEGCSTCHAPLAPPAQRAAVTALLVARGFRFAGRQRSCPACRRRALATAQAGVLRAEFQPRPGAPHRPEVA